jgi:hypothetical protein
MKQSKSNIITLIASQALVCWLFGMHLIVFLLLKHFEISVNQLIESIWMTTVVLALICAWLNLLLVHKSALITLFKVNLLFSVALLSFFVLALVFYLLPFVMTMSAPIIRFGEGTRSIGP